MRTLLRHPYVVAGPFVAASLLVLLAASPAGASSSRSGFGFRASNISGFPKGAVTLTGGGAFDTATGFVHSGGGFRCTTSIEQGPLTGCLAGQGVRWDTAALLTGTPFKCSASRAESPKFATTGDGTVALRADFYRAGDGNDESFTANMIVSTTDLAPDVVGVQNVWVQGVGCATGNVHFGG